MYFVVGNALYYPHFTEFDWNTYIKKLIKICYYLSLVIMMSYLIFQDLVYWPCAVETMMLSYHFRAPNLGYDHSTSPFRMNGGLGILKDNPPGKDLSEDMFIFSSIICFYMIIWVYKLLWIIPLTLNYNVCADSP
jgi:hypothetical protein